MRPTKPLLFATLLSTTTADFFISNTSVCMGTFIVQNCFHGAKVLSGVDPKHDYTCSHLVPAQDNYYLRNGTAGPYGDTDLIVDNGLCDYDKLKFVKVDTGYSVNDENDKHVGDCTWDNATTTRCNMWVGMLFFQSMYRCKSMVCG